MSCFVKKLVCFIFLVCMITSSAVSVGATENQASEMFVDYWENAMNASDSLIVKTANGIDVTEYMIELFNREGIDALYEYVINNSCEIHYQVTSEDEGDVPPMARANKTVTVSEYSYVAYMDATYPKEWRVVLTGRYVYNVGTGELISAQSPYLEIDYASFGAWFVPSLTDVSTDAQIDRATNTVTFSARYRMIATFLPNMDEFEDKVYDYGVHNMSFTARS